jgi:hypothetical protein
MDGIVAERTAVTTRLGAPAVSRMHHPVAMGTRSLPVLAGLVVMLGMLPLAAASSATGPGHLFVHEVEEVAAVQVGTTERLWVRIANDGGAPARVTKVELGGDAVDEITTYDRLNEVVVGAVIERGSPAGLYLEFTPDGVGLRTLTFEVTYDVDPDDGTSETDSVSGETELYGTHDPRGIVPVGLPDHLGQVVQDRWIEFPVTLRNVAEVPLSLAITAGSRSELVDGSDCEDAPLAPGATCTFTGRGREQRVGDFSVAFGIDTLPVWEPRLITIDFEVVEDTSRPDTIEPRLAPLPDPRITKVAFGTPPTITVRQSFSGSDNRPGHGFRVSVTDLATGKARTLRDDAPPFDPPATDATVTTPLSHPVRFAVSVVDSAGNRSTVTKSPAVGSSPKDLTRSMASRARDWVSVRARSARGGSYLRTRRPTARLSTNVTAHAILIVARRGPSSGLLDIYVDGERTARLNLHSSSRGHRLSPILVIDHRSDAFPHRIELVAVRNGSRRTVEVDTILRVR